MKRILTLVLCWLLAFESFGATTFKAKTSVSVAGGYVTSLNKIDGSFEDGSTQWSASVGTIVPTASTEFQGNYKGVWAGTGAGILDLQWTATASNTFEASAQVNVNGEDDVYVCAYVGPTETGCKLIPALSKIQKVSVVADSVISSAFNLRLKHTGSDAFSIDVDDGKIEPWTPQVIGTATSSVVQAWQDGTEWTSYTPTFTGLGTVTISEFKWKKEGSDLLIYGKFNISTDASASEARIGLPNGLVSAITANTTNLAGTMWGSYTSTTLFALSLLWESQKNYLTIGRITNTTNGLTKINGNSLASNEQFILNTRIPIAGWSSAPTLLALPTSKENVFSAKISSTGTRTGQNIDWINSVAVSDTSLYTIDITKLGLTVAPQVNANITGSWTTANAPRWATVQSVSSSSIVIRTHSLSGGLIQYEALPFEIKIQKQSPDYQAPGVFISNLNPDGFNRTTGTTGLIDNFSFSYGTTNATTVCSASPCSYLDQIGNYVTSVTRSGAGGYTANFTKTFSRVKCGPVVGLTSGGGPIFTSSVMSCSNCSSMSFQTNNSSNANADTYGTVYCQGY